MKKVALIFCMWAACGLVIGVCGGDDAPTCKKKIECDPECATDGSEYCDLSEGKCKEVKKCDSACATGTERCDSETGTCVKIACEPQCADDETCAKGTCKKNCDPACKTDEYCDY